MINIDTRLLELVDERELWLLMKIAAYLNADRLCWPSNKSLIKSTGWSENKMAAVKKSLIEKGILVCEKRYREDGSMTSNLYRVTTEYIGIFMPIKEVTPPQELTPPPPQILGRGNPKDWGGNEVLTKEVLTIEQKRDVVLTNDAVSLVVVKKKLKRSEEIAPIVEQIIAYLNKKLGNGKFQADTKVTINLISKILAKGYTLQDFYDVLDFKYDDWIGGKLFDNYAPPTLFAESNFEKYYNAAKRAERNVLPPERSHYYDFMALVKEKYNELWKSNVRIFNAAEYADYQNNITMKGMALQAAENKRKALAAIMAKLNEDYKLRQSYNSLFDAYIALAKTYLP
jgi:uncharacterized phage protein (TIGR02220 family)